MVVIPSECYEGFPRVFVEALAAGTPVVVSRLGGLAELVREGRDGLAFRAGDSGDLHSVVAALARNAQLRDRMRQQARLRFTSEFSPQRAFDSLLREYSAAARLH
jgi:glycosyltransferase involved in cell wall biosynthesis